MNEEYLINTVKAICKPNNPTRGAKFNAIADSVREDLKQALNGLVKIGRLRYSSTINKEIMFFVK